jgi:hypothetical protein
MHPFQQLAREHSSESTLDRHEGVRVVRQRPPTVHPVDVMLWLHALTGDLGRNIDEWMRLHARPEKQQC